MWSAVFYNMFDSVGCCVASWTGIRNGPIQPLLVAQKSWMVSTPQPGQVDSALTGKGGLGRVDVWGPCKQLSVVRVVDVVPLEWLQMFDWRELQMLISGASVPIDLEDLMDNIRYGGIYSTENATIQAFWQVLREFSETQKRQLLKFVTSCSRPPLLGFKELQPAFCIQPSGSEDRLPTASTCMNLLKLPEYKDEHTLRDKLLYAITSGSGFELS
ncbi:Ubiquitin-protein ligase E3C [Chionoecetes opilio]|uniref:HECT-type E3 ubiquitin transferase n=1 Tax=Chionoecetes opilio TaxID=41210 RepID=A0A8J8WDZ8_CHIOP|nr:Ubiquitin-protein ligase E3C [Chionoecetes opilio]